MSDNEFEALEKKDITPDIIIAESKEPAEHEKKEDKKEIPDKDHPLVELISGFMDYTNDHVNKLKREGVEIPEINKGAFEGFLKPFLNKACWHYLPETEAVEDPRICLAVGAGGLALISAPTLIGIWNYYNKRKPKQFKQPKQQPQQLEKSNQNVQQKNQQKENNQQLQQQMQPRRQLSAFG